MSKRPNTSIKRPSKINEGTEIETTLNTQKSTQSNIKIQKRPQTAIINSPKIYNSLSKSTKKIQKLFLTRFRKIYIKYRI